VSDDLAVLLTTQPRVVLTPWATPLHPLDRLRDALGGPSKCPRLLIKRDDLNAVALGGNKLRKLEYLLADAQAQNADTLLTAGAAQSNHARQTAAVGAMHGLTTFLVLRGPEPRRFSGNLILDDWFGAHLYFAEPGQDVTERMAWMAGELTKIGRRPYAIPIGGSNPVGATGYVRAAWEMAVEQGVEPDHLVVATGSGGTQAGLEVGVRLLGLKTKVVGVGVANPDTTDWPTDIANLANATAAHLGADGFSLAPGDVECGMEYMGPTYGEPTIECWEAIRFLACTEGVFVDPVYSGKALAALLDWVRKGRFAPTETVLFWHTGGTPSLFVERERTPGDLPEPSH
jgi:D-cysteine desulfhydrase family pyridoxal phosphate-dependent enzyme